MEGFEELITPDILKKVLVQSGVTDDVESVLSSSREPAVGNGENYCSNIVRTHLKLKLTSGKIFNKSLVLKVFLENLDATAEKEMRQFFANEASMYNNILLNLEKLSMEYNLPYPRAWPQCYFANTDIVVLEDYNYLKERGFNVAPRHNGLNLEDALQVIRFIGRLHALSVVAERRKLIDPHLVRKHYTWVQLDNWTYLFIKKAFKMTGDIIKNWGSQWEEAGQKILDYSDRISKDLYDLYMEDVELKVINHGDAWINNLMVKYNEDKQVETLRFVDFQNAAYTSCGWDLVYFLYTSLQGELLRSNYDGLLTSYRNEFVDTLQLLGDDPSLAPSIDYIKAEIVRLHPFCLTAVLTVQATVFNVAEHPIQVDELITNDIKLRSWYTSDNWKSSIKVHIKYFQEHNLL